MTIQQHAPGGAQPAVVDGELVPADQAGEQHRRRVYHLVGTVRRQTVNVATHERTKTTVRGAARQMWFPVAGAGVVVRRWRDAHGANRYERMMRAAEAAGDREALLEWEARDVAEKMRRHKRAMDWVGSPLQLFKAGAVAIAAVAGLLLVLGVVLAVADGDAALIVVPIAGVISAIRWTAWFLAAYGALVLTGVTAAVVAYLWAVGRRHVEVPTWIASAAQQQGPGRDVVPDEGAILAALRNLGLPALDRKVREGWVPRWVMPTTRDGRGWRTQLELPPGVTVEMINGKKAVLAHNLVRKPVEVWPIEPREQPGVLDLWVADSGVLTRPVDPYPLLTEGTTDYFRGVPVALDQRGEVVTGKLMASNYGLAGIMGSGKTSLVINLLCGGMLDPLVDIDVYVMAFNADYDPMRPRLRTLVKGDEDEQVTAAIDALRELRGEVTLRGKLLAELGGEETKVTRKLAERDARLRPRIVVFDECQEMFRHEKLGAEAKELAIKVMMKARKCAITLVFITPAPSADNLPRDLAKTTSHRVCFAIGDHQGNDAILGTGAHRQGITATGLVPGEDIGTAMAAGFAPKPGLIRTFHIRKGDGVDEITPIVKRAVALREAAGLDDAPVVEAEKVDFLADVAAVMGDAKRMRTTELLSRLGQHNRPAYGTWDPGKLAAALRAEDIRTVASNGYPTVRAADVHERLADRMLDTDSSEEGGE